MAKGNRLAGALGKEPKYSTQPVTGQPQQRAGRVQPQRPTERLSPGVYRGADGSLVNQRGAALQQQPNRQAPMPMGGQWNPQQVNEQFGTKLGSLTQNQGYNVGGMIGSYAQDQSSNVGNMIGSYAQDQGYQVGNKFGSYDPSLNQGPMQNLIATMPQGMPQMPQASANMGGQYRLSPGVYGSREQAMQQYNQQMQPYMMPAMPQRKG